MAYRLYALRPSDLRIVAGTDLEVPDDRTAINAARELFPATPFELWCGERRVFTSSAAERR